MRRGLDTFRQEVEDGVFPQAQHSPYKMPAGEEQAFQRLLAKVLYTAVLAVQQELSMRPTPVDGWLLHDSLERI